MNKREKVWAKTGGRCAYCGQRLHKDNWHTDHVMPKCQGGSSYNLNNLVPSCPWCNQYKGELDPLEFRAKLYSRLDERLAEIEQIAQALFPTDGEKLVLMSQFFNWLRTGESAYFMEANIEAHQKEGAHHAKVS